MYWWRRFHLEEAEADLARIRAAGFDSVRIFLLWEDFQPVPDGASEIGLRRLVAVADAAARNGLLLIPTLFTGHMSGTNWVPEWALGPRPGPKRFRVVSGGRVVEAGLKDWYTDRTVYEAQARLAQEAAAALRGHPALWAWDLGNENSNCVVPPSRQAAVEWLDRMASAIRSADPEALVTIGLHMEDLEEDRRLGPAEAARVCDFLCMHGYPVYARWADGPSDPLLLPFLGLVTRWLGGREVLFEEFGAPTCPRWTKEQPPRAKAPVALLDEEEAARFTGRALRLLHRSGAIGAMLWCYSDYPEELWSAPPFDQAPHERHFGLWRADGTAKPAVAEIAGLAGVELRPADDLGWVDIAPEEYYSAPYANLVRLYRRFRERWSAKEGC